MITYEETCFIFSNIELLSLKFFSHIFQLIYLYYFIYLFICIINSVLTLVQREIDF